jgi:DMSO/TMAO reductase YedYZ molybdopterin-dependent catalytic subunit
MTSASVDRLLALLVVLLATTGLVSLRAGAPNEGWVFVVHGVLAGCLLVAVVLKLRASLPRAVGSRRWRRLALGLTVSLVTLAALTGGYTWVASGEILWLDIAGLIRWTVLTLHAWLGLILVPLVVVHLLPTRWRLLRPRSTATVVRGAQRLVTRRSLLLGATLVTAGIAFRLVADTVDLARGGSRRFTGSRWLPRGGVPPATTFLGEGAPDIDPATWRLSAGDHAFTLDDLRALGSVTSTTVLDCTSGWALETSWDGVSLTAVAEAAGLPSDVPLVVRSLTGWSTVLEPRDAARSVLAWACAGQPLAVGNGAPLRLVVPDRRGLDWVKWIRSIELA